jgi:glycosyltransferase involved in cell wall biosynthesis
VSHARRESSSSRRRSRRRASATRACTCWSPAGGPEEPWLRERLGSAATFLGWLDRPELARAYASSDLFLFCSTTDTYGQVIGEAQASGLAVVAVDAGGAAAQIDDRRTGWLSAPDPDALAATIAQLAASRFLRARIAAGGRDAVRARSWGASLDQLAGAYESALGCGRGARRTGAERQVA